MLLVPEMQPLCRWHGTAVGHMDTVLTMWACRISHILWQAGEVLKGMAANSDDTVRARVWTLPLSHICCTGPFDVFGKPLSCCDLQLELPC
jgi:hypothetical protein